MYTFHRKIIWLKIGFFFKKMTLRAPCLEKLPCHMDFSDIFSINLLLYYIWCSCPQPFLGKKESTGTPVFYKKYIFIRTFLKRF